MKNRFRGSYELKVDDRGRVKIPSHYLSILEEHYGKELYVTSVNGDRMYIYPLSVWEGVEQNIEKMRVRTPELEEYISRTSYWGNECEMDAKGRLLIPPELRSASQLNDNVRIIGKIDHMVLWNDLLFKEKSLKGDFSDEQLHHVSLLLNEVAALSGREAGAR